MVEHVVDVLLPVALDRAYSYRVPDGLTLVPGDLVRVPLGNREATGSVWAWRELPPGLDDRLKTVGAKLPVPPLRAELRALIDWVADYTVSARGMVLRMALRRGEPMGPERLRFGVRLCGPPPIPLTAARRRVLEAAADGLLHGKRELAAEAAVSTGVIDALVDAGTLESLAFPPETVPAPDPDHAAATLTPAQRAAVAALTATLAEGRYAVTLIDGVTGSGKTEVYFEALADTLRRGRQVLILLPEIALTAQFLDRFAARFAVRPAQWHSALTPRRRERTWTGVAAGEVRVVVGARSALFLPFAELGLIIVDEEHDGAFKQEDGVHYHARDMAVVRARLADIPIVLASATPSVETEVNARRGRYRRLHLPERFGGQHLPLIEAIDLRREGPPRGRYVAERLLAAIKTTIARGDQALLFLNRRGYAPLTLCRACGFRLKCPHCEAWLVEHRFQRQLRCHYCGFGQPRPPLCPACQASDAFVACGPGVERLAEELAASCPEGRLLVLSSDVVASVERLREEFAKIEDGRVDIIIGTQLVAKGHHFPKLNLVGIIDADLGLGHGDLRAAERTFQLLHQVVGRAGREQGRGQGLVQTHQPDHPVMRALLAQDREAFYAHEIAAREQAGYPPFGRLASLVVSAPDKLSAESLARKLALRAPAAPAVRILGPAEAPIAVIRGRHRFRLLAKAPRGFDLSGYVRDWLADGPKPQAGQRVDIDVDPQSFL
ncbi:MAG TPA: primosomal protein N' [Xanthobacteraceae bacterium]|nr:primosomal protein N' [Xanthobacteraceae bacterium]